MDQIVIEFWYSQVERKSTGTLYRKQMVKCFDCVDVGKDAGNTEDRNKSRERSQNNSQCKTG